MAYANLVNETCADKTAFFCKTRDFICKRNGTYDYSSTGIGWTLVDSSYATDEDNPAINDWYVIYSAGEGTDDDLFFKVTWINGYLKIQGYISWNSTTHAGAIEYNATTNSLLYADAQASASGWVYGDLDQLILITDDGTNLRGTIFGKLAPIYDDTSATVATCSSTLTAGSDVSIVVDAVPDEWAVGREIFIRTTHNDNTSTVKVEKTEIKTLSGTTITADLTNSYTADSKLATFVGYNCPGNVIFFATQYVCPAPDGSATSSGAPANHASISSTSTDPESYESRWAGSEFVLPTSVGLAGKYNNIYAIWIGALSLYDVLEDTDGTEWRYFKLYNNKNVVVKEV